MSARLEVQHWPIGRVTPYEGNPRIISESAVEKVAASLTEYGWRQPLVVDEQGVIIAGHTRLRAARLLELEEVPVHVVSGMPKEKIDAYRLMDNRSADEAQWDFDVLQDEFDKLIAVDFDPSLTGFDELEIATLPTSAGIEFPEYDESIADEVEMITCPECGHTWPG